MSMVPLDGDGESPRSRSETGESAEATALFSDDQRGQYAAALRKVIDPGFRWVGVEYYEQSLTELDTWPDVAATPADTGRPIDIVDARHWAARLDGVRVSLCGQQRRLQQVGSADGHVEWAFQMESNQKRAAAFAFVRVRLPLSELPPTEPEDHLTWASGYFVARGRAVVDGDVESGGRNCMYLVADHVFFTPKATTRREQRGSLTSRLRSTLRRT